MMRFLAAGLTFGMATLTITAEATAQGYSIGEVTNLEDAVQATLRSSPQLMIQQGAEDLALSDLDQARSLGRFRIDLSASGGLQNTDTSSVFAIQEGQSSLANAQVQASKPVWTSGRIPASIRSARAGLDAAAAQTEGARQGAVLQAVTAYADVLQARDTVRIRVINLSTSAEQSRAARDRFEVGEITRTDVALASAREEAARANYAAAEANVVAAEAAFIEVVGATPVQQLSPLPPLPPLPPTIDEALDYALKWNPAITAAEGSLRAASEAVTATRGGLGPQVSVIGRASTSETWDNRQTDTSVSVIGQASIPLWDGDQVRSRVRGAIARKAQAQSQVDLVRRQVIRDLTSAWAAYIAAERGIEAGEARAAAAEVAYNGSQQELSVGQRTTLDVLDAEAELYEAQLALLASQRDAYVAGYRILTAMGALETGGAAFQP